jgi:transposase
MNKKSTPQKNWREERRMQAWKLHEQGWKQKDIAEALGVTEGAVSQWVTKAKTQGVEALRHTSPPGATPKLNKEQQAQLPALLERGAEAFGFRGQVWTTARVAQMIEQQFGVKYHPAHCSLLLRKLKWSQQKPIKKATQRDEAAIHTWKECRFDEVKKKPKRRDAQWSLWMSRLSISYQWLYIRMPRTARRLFCVSHCPMTIGSRHRRHDS